MDINCSTHGRDENAYKTLVGKPGGKGPLGRNRRTWEDNIKIDFKEVAYDESSEKAWISLNI
jgi:hypothetical protein